MSDAVEPPSESRPWYLKPDGTYVYDEMLERMVTEIGTVVVVRKDSDVSS